MNTDSNQNQNEETDATHNAHTTPNATSSTRSDATMPQNAPVENAPDTSAEDTSAEDASAEDASTESDELAAANDKFLRLVAEFENFKRQAARREIETRERAARNVIEDLLPVLDNFERAVEAARTSDDIAGVRMGVEFIAQQFRDTLKGHGVEAIETQGQPFDPTKHDALEEIESEHPAGTIVNEAQRGYLYKGQVMRASRVRVAS